MSLHLDFSVRYRFRTTYAWIVIPCLVEQNGLVANFEAKVDTDSEYCLLRRELAEELFINVEDGLPVPLHTLAGSFTAYAHTVVLTTSDIQFESTVLFNAAAGVDRNILGRTGWLNNLHLGLTMDDETIYLRPAYGNL